MSEAIAWRDSRERRPENKSTSATSENKDSSKWRKRISKTSATSFSADTVRRARRRWSTRCWSRPVPSNGHPSVDEGTSICDFDPEEKHHKYTIEASVVHFEHGGKHFNVIDTPGYPDFIGQTIGALRGVDTAPIVINAQSGIEVNTRRVFEEAGKAGLGRMIVINKMDAENVDFAAVLESIQEMWGPACVPLNVPIGHGPDFKGVVSTLNVPDDTTGALMDPNEIHDPLLESIIEVDEGVMERYFEGTPPTDEELSRLIVRAVAEGSLVPILCCSGKTDVGVTELLDAIAMCGLSSAVPPNARRPRTVKKSRSCPTRTVRWLPRSSRHASTRSSRN